MPRRSTDRAPDGRRILRGGAPGWLSHRVANGYPGADSLNAWSRAAFSGAVVVQPGRIGNRVRCIALIGLIHPGESGPELIVPVLERLLENESALLERCGVAAFPLVNADGRERQVAGVPHYLRTNAHGVDLNRNFPADWEQVETGYGLVSSDPDALTWRGPAPASEPETRAVMQWLKETRPEAVFSMHCLASICSPVFLASRRAEGDAAFTERSMRLLRPYTAGYYGDPAREPALRFAGSAGGLSHWLYREGAIPAFDLEWDRDEATRPCINDGTTPEMVEACARAHYHGIRAVLKEIG